MEFEITIVNSERQTAALKLFFYIASRNVCMVATSSNKILAARLNKKIRLDLPGQYLRMAVFLLFQQNSIYWDPTCFKEVYNGKVSTASIIANRKNFLWMF